MKTRRHLTAPIESIATFIITTIGHCLRVTDDPGVRRFVGFVNAAAGKALAAMVMPLGAVNKTRALRATRALNGCLALMCAAFGVLVIGAGVVESETAVQAVPSGLLMLGMMGVHGRYSIEDRDSSELLNGSKALNC